MTKILPTGSEGQEDAPHGSELVVISVPAPLPAFCLAGDGAVHPEWKRLSILKSAKH